jgi:hypothetical protein
VESQDHLARKALQDLLACKDHLDQWDKEVKGEKRVHLVVKVHLVLVEDLETKVLLDLLV